MLDKRLLAEKALEIRLDTLKMIHLAGSGHPGGSLSEIEILTYLYFHKMRIDPQNAGWEMRDRFVLSKGHCCPPLYAALAGRGYFDRDILWTLRAEDSILQGHPDMKKTPGIDMTTGSLGQGLSVAAGMAKGAKITGSDFHVYVLVGDGEIQSGQIWEAAMAAGYYELDNLTMIIDNNGLQCDGAVSQIMDVDPIADKFKAFRWDVFEADGHCFESLDSAFEQAGKRNGRPKAIIANTTKGKGVSYMENNCEWHGKPLSDSELDAALQELRGERQ